MAHGRGHAEGTPIIFILMSTPTCNWFGLMLTFIFYYIGHCLLLVLHWIGVSVTFLVSPSVHLWGQMATPDDKWQAVVQGWGRRPGHRTCYLSGDPINIPVPCTWRQGTCLGTWEGTETWDTTHVIGQQYNFGVCWLLLQTIKPIQYKQASTSWTKGIKLWWRSLAILITIPLRRGWTILIISKWPIIHILVLSISIFGHFKHIFW